MTTCVASAALLVASAGLAQAYDPDAPATDVAEAIAAVAPDAGEVLEAARTGDAFAARAGQNAVVVPEDASVPVSITSTDPALADLTVALPDLAGADAVRQAADGTLVYTSDEDAWIAVQPLADGSTRFLSVLENESAPERYDYTFEGFDLVQQEDGSVLVLDGEEPVGVVAAPWATDAEGVSVPTRYEVGGSTLTQVVDHVGGGFAYPITADPLVTKWWGIQLQMSNSQVNKPIKAINAGAGAAGVAAILAATGVISSPGAIPLSAAAAIGWFGGAALCLCNWNDRGVNLNRPWIGPMTCTAR